MTTILLLGSGELGKEFAIAAQRLGQTVVACDKYAGAPAMQVADAAEVFDMLDGDALAAAVYEHDVVVPAMNALRDVADELETLVDEKAWPFPAYGDLLFRI